MNTASHILHGVWRREDAGQIAFNSLAFWVKLAQELERGLFDVLFEELTAHDERYQWAQEYMDVTYKLSNSFKVCRL